MSQSRLESKEASKIGLAKLSNLVKSTDPDEIKRNSAEIMKIIADANAANEWCWYSSKEYYVQNAMRDAILAENIEILRLFLEAGISGDTCAYSNGTKGFITPFIEFAAQKGNLPIVQLLIAHKADIKPRNDYHNKGDDSAMRAAIEYNHPLVVNYLLENGASARGVYKALRPLSFLAKAAQMGHVEIVEILIKKGASPKRAISLLHSKFKDENRHRRDSDSDPESKEEYSKAVKLLLDHAPGMDLNKEAISSMDSSKYDGLTFLRDISDISDFNFAGISLAGIPITHSTLAEAKLKGAENAIVEFSDFKKIKESSRVEKIQSLIEEAVNKQGEIIKDGIVNLVPLDRAAEIGDEKTVQIRLQAGVDPNIGETEPPLVLAAKMGHTNIVALLLKDARLNKETLPTALKEAQDKKHRAICELLIGQQDVNQKDKTGRSLLHTAIERGEIEEVASLISRKADVNLEGPNGYPLYMAASKSCQEYDGQPSTEHITILQLLLGAKANPNQLTWGDTALSCAAAAGSAEAVKILLPVTEKRDIKFDLGYSGENYKYLPWYTDMLFDSRRSPEWLEILTLLKAHGADLNTLDKHGHESVLHIALRNFPSLSDIHSTMRGLAFSIKGAEDRVPSSALEEEQAKLIAKSRERFFKHLLEIDILLSNGVDPNIQDHEGRTPLHIFIEKVDLRHVEDGFSQVVDRFIKKGFKINQQNKYGRTLLHKAAEKGDFRAVEYLLKQDGIDINIPDNMNRTPLHLAAAGSPITTKLLIAKGANIHAVTTAGDTPILFSRRCCEEEQKKCYSPDTVRQEIIESYTKAQNHLHAAEVAQAKAKLEEKSIGLFAHPKPLVKTSAELKRPAAKPMTIVLDLDDVLVSPIQNKEYKELINEFTKHGLCIEVSEISHLIHPGTLELLQTLYSHPDLNVAFFSSAIKKRNEELVPKLLKLALGEAAYNEIMSKGGVQIASREDLSPGNADQSTLTEKFGSWFYGNKKKDLSKIAKTPEHLSNTIIIEDDPSYIMQGKNVLHVMPVHYGLSLSLATKSKKLTSNEVLSANHLFYAAGLLFAAIQKATTDKISLSDALYGLAPRLEFMKPDNYDELMKYYHLGLQELRKINPTLDYMSASYSLSPQSSRIGIEADKKAALHKDIEKQASLAITI